MEFSPSLQRMPFTARAIAPMNPAPVCWIIAIAAYFLTGDWLAATGIFVLWAGWRFLPNIGGPPVLAMAFTYQWCQVFSGIYYYGITGRTSHTIEMSEYRPMVMIGMGALVALLLGLFLGTKLIKPSPDEGKKDLGEVLGFRMLVICYTASFALVGILQTLAWQFPAFTQALISLTFLRYALVFLLLRKLAWPKLQAKWFILLVIIEIIFGLTGYFASFRESLVLAVLVLLERFDARKYSHWFSLAGAMVLIVSIGVVWTGIKGEYRARYNQEESFAQSTQARLSHLAEATSNWIQGEEGEQTRALDGLVDRLWAVYYPALAVTRVPEIVPHTNGIILFGAVKHVFAPRFLFPEKGGLLSDSELVRSYSGVWVAGEESGVSIAFGYVAESYVDFGLPWMFLPIFVYGVLMGMAYRAFYRLIAHRDLAIAVGSVVFWISLYLFERSWVKMLGQGGTIMIYLTLATLLLDRFLLSRRLKRTTVAEPRKQVLVTS